MYSIPAGSPLGTCKLKTCVGAIPVIVAAALAPVATVVTVPMVNELAGPTAP